MHVLSDMTLGGRPIEKSANAYLLARNMVKDVRDEVIEPRPHLWSDNRVFVKEACEDVMVGLPVVALRSQRRGEADPVADVMS